MAAQQKQPLLAPSGGYGRECFICGPRGRRGVLRMSFGWERFNLSKNNFEENVEKLLRRKETSFRLERSPVAAFLIEIFKFIELAGRGGDKEEPGELIEEAWWWEEEEEGGGVEAGTSGHECLEVKEGERNFSRKRDYWQV